MGALYLGLMAMTNLLKWSIGAALLLYAVVPRADDAVDAAVRRLAKVETFAFGGTGYAGVTSKGEIDFRLLVSQPPQVALAAFEKLYAAGNPQGKSYALSGFKKLDPRRFKELLAAGGDIN